jgi:hypothetical protein
VPLRGGIAAAPAEPWRVADTPDQLTLARHRDLQGRERRPVARWVALSMLSAFCVLGLGNAFGQRPGTEAAEGPEARLEVYAPTHLRGGLIFEARFTVEAREELERATLVLDPGWLEGITLNTVEPAPIGEANRDGALALELGHVPAGTRHVLFLHFQVNPTNVGRRRADVALEDGERRLLEVRRTVTVYP